MEIQLDDQARNDRDRIAVQKGYEDVQAGRLRPFSEFDAEMRKQLGMSTDA